MFDNIDFGNFIGLKDKDNWIETFDMIYNSNCTPFYTTNNRDGEIIKEMEKVLGKGVKLAVLAVRFKHNILA